MVAASSLATGRVVDAGEVDGDVARVAAAVAVLDRVVEAGRAVAAQVRVGREGHGAVVVQHRRAARGVGHGADGERPSVSVSLPTRSALSMTRSVSSVPGGRVVDRDRGHVGHAVEVDGDVGRVGPAVAVADRVLEAGLAVAAQVGIRREGHDARGQVDRAAGGVEHGADRQGVALDVAVVVEDGRGDVVVGRVLVDHDRVVVGDRVVVDALDVDGHVAGVGVGAVADRVVEPALAVAAHVRVGREGDRAGVERDAAAGGAGDAGEGEGVALGVGVVGQEVGVGDLEGGVLGRGGRVVDRHGCVVDALEVDRDVAGVGAAVAVVDRVVEAGRAVAAEVRVRA